MYGATCAKRWLRLMALREVTIPLGRLYLAAMPGRRASLQSDLDDMSASDVTKILCLAPDDEIAAKSPEYSNRLHPVDLPFLIARFDIPDYGAPEDRDAFAKFVFDAADGLRRGENLLLHCGAGIGRTGMTAICILLALGYSETDARRAVVAAGSGPERPQQEALIVWFAGVAARPSSSSSTGASA